MQKDYKMFPPSVDWDNINWSTRRPQMDFPVQVYYILSFFLALIFYHKKLSIFKTSPAFYFASFNEVIS